MSPDEAERLVTAAIDRYIAERHRKVDAFVDANYAVRGSLRLHRHAFGYDLLRAPANVALAVPQLAVKLAASALPRMGFGGLVQRMRGWTLLLDTDVGRELTWRFHTELLELPYDDDRRRSEADALAAAVAADPRIALAVDSIDVALARSGNDPALRRRLSRQVEAYVAARSAAAELANAMLLAGAGSVLFRQLTPGALSLGPAVAGALAQQTAIASFPLGASAGALWYGAFSAAPSTALVAGATGGLIGLSAVLTAFAGVVTDPVLRASGVHRRRLHRFIDALGAAMKGESGRFQVRDHYVARVFDLLDLARLAAQTTR